MILLPLLFLLIVSEPLWRWWHIRHWEPDPRDAIKLDSLVKVWQGQVSGSDSSLASGRATKARVNVYFRFDPNSATTAELIRLGFGERLAQRIENYRKKGGVFKAKQDLLKIYGMDTAQYQRLASFVVIAKNFEAKRKGKAPGSSGPNRTTFAGNGTWPKHENDEPFDINLADSARLEAVRGIGQKLSRRIIKYRSSLGGFVHVGQLKEVFGLDSVTLAQMMQTAFIAPDFLPDRIDLNLADEKMMEAHPYISRQEARTIVAYRFQHGRFASVSDLRKLPMFSDEKVRRLEPYLKAVE